MPKLSLVIPVYNEGAHLRDLVNHLLGVKFPCEVELILIDDGSRDDSWAVMQQLDAPPRVRCVRQPANAGKGAAIRRGFELAEGDVVAVQDADYEYDPRDLARLVEPILAGRADVVYGSRFHKGRVQVRRTFHYLVNRFLTLASNLLSDLYLTDMETCYKVFRADLLKALELKTDRFGFEPEVTALIAKLRVRIEEHPIDYYPRNYDQGKKIGWRDGIAALWFILKFNMTPLSPTTIQRLPERYRPGATGLQGRYEPSF